MRTTLDLPEHLLQEAMQRTRAKTKTAVITLALEELICKSKVAELKSFKGKIDLKLNLHDLRGR